MEKTTRRNLLKVAAAGGVAAAGFATVLGSDRAVPVVGAAPEGRKEDENEHLNHGNGPDDDKKADATMSFGEWGISAAGAGLPGPLDRFTPATAHPINRNVHRLLPKEVTIEAGGSVNFIISGFHLVLVYDDGVEMGDIDTTLLTPGSTPPGLIDDPQNRIYRGLDPRALNYMPTASTPAGFSNQDRVETVQFPVPGRYFVACGVRPHFNQGMNGYVNVKTHSD